MKLFAHPDNVCMSYSQHLILSLKIVYYLLFGAFKGFIHSFIPDLYINFIDDTNNTILKIVKRSGCHKPHEHLLFNNTDDNNNDDVNKS